MNIKLSFALVAVIAASLTACKKSGNSDDASDKKLKYLIKTTSVQEGVSSVTNTYTYDSKKRITGQKTTGGSSESETTYAYNGDQLFEIEIYQPGAGFSDVNEFLYANDKTIATARKRTYRNNVLNSDVNYSYYYTNGKISQIKHDIYTDTYTYDSRGNVIKRVTDEFSGFTSEWTYDDKVSPNNGFPKYMINSTFSGICPNNVLTRPPGSAFTYVYDSDGYPVSATSGAVKYTYTYTEM